MLPHKLLVLVLVAPIWHIFVGPQMSGGVGSSQAERFEGNSAWPHRGDDDSKVLDLDFFATIPNVIHSSPPKAPFKKFGTPSSTPIEYAKAHEGRDELLTPSVHHPTSEGTEVMANAPSSVLSMAAET